MNRKSTGLSMVLLVAAATVASAQQYTCPESLLSLPGAENIDCRPIDGKHRISYGMEIPYPAEQAIRDLQAKLRTKGWLPLPDDPLNPGLGSAHVDGWSRFSDDTLTPGCTGRQWIADWVNLEGDVLHFVFRYSNPEDGPEELTDLHVVGILSPVNVRRQENEEAPERSGGDDDAE